MGEIGGLAASSAADQGFDEGRLNKIGPAMASAVESRHVSGAVTVVARRGKVVHSNVVGSLDLDAQDGKLGMNSLFRMYSQSKPVCAVVTMSLF